MRSEKGLKNKYQYEMEYSKNHYKRIPLDVTFLEYEEIRTAAGAANMPVNTYIKAAIREKMGNDGKENTP